MLQFALVIEVTYISLCPSIFYMLFGSWSLKCKDPHKSDDYADDPKETYPKANEVIEEHEQHTQYSDSSIVGDEFSSNKNEEKAEGKYKTIFLRIVTRMVLLGGLDDLFPFFVFLAKPKPNDYSL